MKLRRSSFSSSIVTKDTSCYSSSSRRRRRGGLQITCSLSSFLLLPLFVYLSRNGSSINAFLLPSPSIDVKVALMRRHVSERQIPQYLETMKLYYHNDSSKPVTPVTFNQQEDFVSYLGDEKLVAKPGEEPYKLVHVSKAPLFSPEECQAIIDECEERAAKVGWATKRHFAYPTTDVPLKELPRTLEWFNEKLQERIYPCLASNFAQALPDSSKLKVVDAFIVKYDADGGQTQLKPHRDGSVVSFNVALNPSSEFEGGGTYFKGLDDGLRIEQGHIVTHASNVLHGGHPITSGKRYILVSFVILEGFANWAMRFANLVWDY